MKKTLTADELLKMAQNLIGLKGQAHYAKLAGLSQSYFNQILNGRRPVNEAFAKAFGYSEVKTTYARIK